MHVKVKGDERIYVVDTLDSIHIAHSYPANSAAVSAALAPDAERSDWRWFRLANGDLILGFYPQAGTYEELELHVENDYKDADRSLGHRYIFASPDDVGITNSALNSVLA